MKFFKKYLSRKFIITQEVIMIAIVLLIMNKLPANYFTDIIKFATLIYIGGNLITHPSWQNLLKNNNSNNTNNNKSKKTFLD